MRSIEGVYRKGKVELAEPAPDQAEGRVIVTFLAGSTAVDLDQRGINPQQAEDLRARLSTFAEDWQLPEMDVYDAL